MTISGFSLLSQSTALGCVHHHSCSHTGMVCPTHDVVGQCHSSTKCFLCAAGFILGGAAIGYFIGYKLAMRKARINHKIQLANEKVVDTVDIEDIGEKKAFCRCWKSEKFPYCDGSHSKHNNETGDNVGPLLVKGKH